MTSSKPFAALDILSKNQVKNRINKFINNHPLSYHEYLALFLSFFEKFSNSYQSVVLKLFRFRRYFFSIHRFLVISILTILTFVVGFIAFLNYWQISSQNNQLFDAQLINAAQVIDTLVSLEIQKNNSTNLTKLLEESNQETFIQLAKTRYPDGTRLFQEYIAHIAFQVWNTQTNQLILKSDNAPNTPLSKISHGFNYSGGNAGKSWHSFTITNQFQHTRTIIAMKNGFSESISFALFLHDLTILIIMYLLIAISILWAIQYALHPLKQISTELRERDPSGLHPLNASSMPIEVRPLLKSINRLFRRVSEAMQREKSFTADAAHELRTPLAALKTQIQVALKEKDDQVRQKILNNIIVSGNRCAHVIEQLLTLSRLSPEAKISYQNLVNFSEVTEELVAEMAPLAIQKNIEIELNSPEKPLFFYGNKISLGILLRNLIANAIIYTPEQGHISVLLSEQKNKIVLQVIDSGPGVPKELRSRIFDRFYRQIGNKADGSGLGLSIVKEIVQLHQGHIEARTPKSGAGLEIWVGFPKKIQINTKI